MLNSLIKNENANINLVNFEINFDLEGKIEDIKNLLDLNLISCWNMLRYKFSDQKVDHSFLWT